jgi:lactate dehydrogenase-like 2-hydroxyacid dehydrogenase
MTPARAIDPDLAKFVDLWTLLAESDFVLIQVALTPETHHLIGSKVLVRMKPSAILINTARGLAVDHEAPLSALCRPAR